MNTIYLTEIVIGAVVGIIAALIVAGLLLFFFRQSGLRANLGRVGIFPVVDRIRNCVGAEKLTQCFL